MKTQAWGWLIAGVLAAALNASYHDGGLDWAHRFADRVAERTQAVLALAAPQAEPLLLEARLLTSGDTRASCRVAAAMARVQSEVARSEAGIGRFEAMSAREQAQLARIEANRARIEARVARMRIPAVAVDPAVFHAAPVFPVCSRVRVNIPRMPKLTMPTVPVIHVKAPSAGPV